MKIAYLCAFAHVTVIEKGALTVGTYPNEIQCAHLHCLHSAFLFTESQIDETVLATHKFFDKNDVQQIISDEENKYLEAGGLMFKEIPENVGRDVKNEFKNTEEMVRLATFLVNNVDVEDRLPNMVDTVIMHLKKYFGHLAVMQKLNQSKN